MEKTQATNNIGSEDNAYALLALLTDSTKLIITNLIETLKIEIGDGLWTMPAEGLHITLCEIIQAKPYSQDKEAIYAASREDYENIPSKILGDFKPIKIHFNKIVVSPQAIIIQGQDDGSFNNIRQQLVNKLLLPSETKLPPDIVHISIARFTKKLDLGKIKQIAASHSIDCEEIVQEFTLIKNLVMPFLRYRTIRTYPLVK